MSKTGAKTSSSKGGIWAFLLEIGIKLATDLAPKVWEFIKARLNGKTIAVIGPTASGKDSLIARLRGLPVPEVHVNTGAPEKIKKYKIEQKTPNGDLIELYVKEGMNVGGEETDREDYWGEACKGADFIFYMVDISQFIESIGGRDYTGRIVNDMRWVSGELGKNQSAKLLVVANKIDIADKALLGKALVDLRESIRKTLNAQSGRLVSVHPMTTRDDYEYSQLMPSLLKAAADA